MYTTIIYPCNSQINNNYNFNIVKHFHSRRHCFILNTAYTYYTNIRKVLKRVPYWKKYFAILTKFSFLLTTNISLLLFT